MNFKGKSFIFFPLELLANTSWDFMIWTTNVFYSLPCWTLFIITCASIKGLIPRAHLNEHHLYWCSGNLQWVMSDHRICPSVTIRLSGQLVVWFRCRRGGDNRPGGLMGQGKWLMGTEPSSMHDLSLSQCAHTKERWIVSTDCLFSVCVKRMDRW